MNNLQLQQSQFEIIHSMLNPEVDENGIAKAIHARSLHYALGISKDFSNWLKQQFKRMSFVEGVDYWEVVENLAPPLGGARSDGINDGDRSDLARPRGRASWGGSNRREYILTPYCAKHISQNTDTVQGHMVRDYFIRRDEQLRALEEEYALLLIERNDLLEARVKVVEDELSGIVGREAFASEITATQLAQTIGAMIYEITGEEETVFCPTAQDINRILFKMGLIGGKNVLGEMKPNPCSVLNKFFVEYPGVPKPKFFFKNDASSGSGSAAMKFNAGSENIGSLVMDLKAAGIKFGIGCK